MPKPRQLQKFPLSSSSRHIRRLILFLLSLWAPLAGCATEPVLPPTADVVTTDIYNEQIFHERVRGLHRISLGAGEAEIVWAFGQPTERLQADGRQIYVYRLRCPKAGSPFGAHDRMVYLNWETRVTFNQRGRVAAVSHRQ